MIELERQGRLVLPSETLTFARIEMSRYSLAGETLIKFCLWPPGEARHEQAAVVGDADQPIVILARPTTVLPTPNDAGENISLITFDGQVAEIEVYAPDALLVAQRLDALLGSGAGTPLRPTPPPGA